MLQGDTCYKETDVIGRRMLKGDML